MTQEFTDFCRIIDEKDYDQAAWLSGISLGVMRVLDEARKKAGLWE